MSQPVQGQDGQWYVQNPATGAWELWQQPQAAPVAAPAPQVAPPVAAAPIPAHQPAAAPAFGGPPAAPAQAAGGNPFFGLNTADPSGGARHPFFLDGTYQFALSACKLNQSRKGKLNYIIEVDILASSNPQRPAGTKAVAFIDMSNSDTRDRHVKRFVCAMLGQDPDAPQWKGALSPDGRPWDACAWESVDDSQPWRGRKGGVVVSTLETKSGDDWTLHSWCTFEQATVVAVAPTPAAAPVAAPNGAPAAAGAPPMLPPGVNPGPPPGMPQAAPAGPPPMMPSGGMPPAGMPAPAPAAPPAAVAPTGALQPPQAAPPTPGVPPAGPTAIGPAE